MAGVRTFKTTTITASGALQRVLGPNTKRVGLLVFSNGTGVCSIGVGEQPTGINTGMMHRLEANPLRLMYEDIGPAIKAGIFLFGTATVVLGFAEILDDTLTTEEISGT